MSVAQNRQGFTFIEMMVVIAILAVVVFIAVGVGAGGFTKNQIRTEADSLVSILRLAQSRTVSRHQENVWGVHITSSDYTLFIGDDYTTRDASFDEYHTFPGGIAASGLTDVIFEFRTGETLNVGDVVLSNADTGDSITINVNANGRVSY